MSSNTSQVAQIKPAAGTAGVSQKCDFCSTAEQLHLKARHVTFACIGIKGAFHKSRNKSELGQI